MTQKGNSPEGQQKKKSIPPNPKGKKVVKPSTVTMEMDANAEERIEHFEEVDYSEHFITNETFKSKEELRDWAKLRGQAQNMFIIVGTSNQQKMWLQCERSGKYRTTKLKIEVESRKFTGSKKCLCPFSLKGWKTREGVWRLCVMNGKHNHSLAVYHHGHSLVNRLTQKQYEITAKLTKSDMKPKEILDHLRQEDPNATTTLKHIYNARNKIRVEEMGVRGSVKQLMHCIQEHGYTQWHRVDAVSNEITDVMFAHSRSIQLLRLFPYVLSMESTHRTEGYKLTLLEIIGVTPVRKNFNVAFAFMTNESEESYRWALTNLRSLFEENVRPNVIVTDRELELMKALELIFPQSYHLLCLFHINKNVESNAIKLMGVNKEMALIFLQQKWKKLVDSRSVEEYKANYNDMLWQYEADRTMLRYLEETWLIYKEKFVRAWTGKVFHFGCTTIRRVESVHSILKRCLGSSTSGFDSFWTQIHSEVEGQITGIEVALAISRRAVKHGISYCCFNNLIGYATYVALNNLYQERIRGRNSTVGMDPLLCGCYLRSTHGLPCAHEIALKEQEHGMFFTDDVHVFWGTLGSDDSMPIDDDLYQKEIEKDIARLPTLFEELQRQPIKEQEVILDAIGSVLFPEQAHPDKPSVMRPMSYPKKNSICGDPSPWKHTISPIGRFSSGSQNSHGRLSSGSQRGHDHSSSGSVSKDLSGRGGNLFERGHGKSSLSFAAVKYSTEFPPFSNELPSFLVPYIISWLNVAGDGNCGYRVVADIVYGSEDKWMDVRRDLYLEIIKRFELYKRIYGSENAIRTVLLSLCHWEKGMAPKHTWMTLLDIGLVIATRYNAVVLELSATQNFTYLPLFDDDGVGQISRFIPICYLPANEHYVLLNLGDQCPLPPFYQQWTRFRDDSVAHLDDAFSARRNFWDFLQAQG